MEIKYEREVSIEFYKKAPFIHWYKVEGFHDNLSQFKEEITTGFHEEKKERWGKGLWNVSLSKGGAFEYSTNIFYYIINNYYFVTKPFFNSNIQVYIQDNKEGRSIPHSHETTSTITATTYLDPPEEGEGGELELSYNEQKMRIQPKKDIIYFFPSWLTHRPLPQTREKPRVCLNWGYDCEIRPIHKLTGDRW